MDVFSRSLFAKPTCNQDAKTIAEVLNNILIEHAYLPMILISKKLSLCVSRNQRSGRRHWHYSKGRHYKARTNNWAAWKISPVNLTSSEDWNRRAKIIVVWIRQQCGPQLQYVLSHKKRLWAGQRFSWTYSLQYLGFQFGKVPTASTHSQSANCQRCFWPNRGDLTRCSQKHYPGLQKIWSL